MHAAAESQRLRMVDELERHRSVQVDAIKVRSGAESEQLKKTTKDDIGEIDAWAKTATELVAAERVRRIDARRDRLQAELLRQDVIVQREVIAIEGAVEAHRAELDAFFRLLEREEDPAGIARMASSMPSLPSLLEAADAAKRQAASEFSPLDEPTATATGDDDTADDATEVTNSRLMAVMAPGASSGGGANGARPWEHAQQAVAVPAEGGATTADAADANEGAPESNELKASVVVETRPLLRTIPSTRPMDRLRSWNHKPDEEPDRKR